MSLSNCSASTSSVSPVGSAEKHVDAMHVVWCHPGEGGSVPAHPLLLSLAPRDQSSAQRNVGLAIEPRYTSSWSAKPRSS
eukprot:4812056-Prymnesium_polylepis.1